MEVLDVAVETQILDVDRFEPLLRESVSQCYVLDADVRAVFDVAVGDAVVVVGVVEACGGHFCAGIAYADVGDVVIPCSAVGIHLARVDGHELGAVVDAVELVCPCRLHVRELEGKVVEHIVAVRAVDEDVEVEVLVAEGVVEAEGEIGQRRADDSAVFFVDLAVLVDVLVLDVTDPYGVALVEVAVGGEWSGRGELMMSS